MQIDADCIFAQGLTLTPLMTLEEPAYMLLQLEGESVFLFTSVPFCFILGHFFLWCFSIKHFYSLVLVWFAPVTK